MAKKKIVILGAGLAGLSAAWHLKEKGIDSSVFEKESTVGGLCRSKEVKGFVFDYDGHLMHFQNSYTLQLAKKLLKGNLARHERSAWINHFGIFSRYPFQANLHALPPEVASECLWGFIKATDYRAKCGQDNFLKWINGVFGSGIARHFMEPYNKKFWTVPLNRISCSWADKFIPKLGLLEVVNGFFAAGNDHLGYNAFFWYPKKGGIIQLAQGFERQISEVFKNCCISAIDLRKKEISVNGGKEKMNFSTLILTIPLPELVKIVKPLPAKIADCLRRLRWNSIFNLNLGIDGPCQEHKHWIYFPHQGTIFFRAGFFHSFSKTAAPPGKSSLYTEVSYSKNKPIDKKKIVRQVLRGLHKSKVIDGKSRILAVDTNDIKYGYPIYDRNYFKATSQIRQFLSANGVITCGRYGSWQYMSMEDSILDGSRAAQEAWL